MPGGDFSALATWKSGVGMRTRVPSFLKIVSGLATKSATILPISIKTKRAMYVPSFALPAVVTLQFSAVGMIAPMTVIKKDKP